MIKHCTKQKHFVPHDFEAFQVAKVDQEKRPHPNHAHKNNF